MEQIPDSIAFERQTVLHIRGVRFIVNSYFDDNQDSLKDKVVHLLKNDVARLQNQSEYDIMAA